MRTLQETINKRSEIEMSEDRFWEIVEGVNWDTLSQQKERINFDEISETVAEPLSYKEIVDLRSIASIAWNELDVSIGSERNPAGGGDDAHTDLLYHIIGLGKEQFYAHLSDYDKIQVRGKAPYGSKEGYRECFAYCLPYSADYANKTDDKDDRKEYDVQIEATVRKTIRVKAENEDEATELAHQQFVVVPEDGVAEDYDELTVSVKEVKNEN